MSDPDHAGRPPEAREPREEISMASAEAASEKHRDRARFALGPWLDAPVPWSTRARDELLENVAAALARVEAETLERGARHVESMKNGMTCVIFAEPEDACGTDGVLTHDIDGPWFLKSEIAQALRALATEGCPQPDAAEGTNS